MTDAILWSRRGTVEPDWQIGAPYPDPARLTLFGWDLVTAPVDGGMPPVVAGAVARALGAVARVTFPCSSLRPPRSESWTPVGRDLIRSLAPAGWPGRVVARIAHAGRDHEAVLSTRRAETIVGAFTDSRFPWWLQSQVLLLSEPDAEPPEIDTKTLLALIKTTWTLHADSVKPLGVSAILRPGVDGDFMALLSLTGDLGERFADALKAQALSGGLGWTTRG